MDPNENEELRYDFETHTFQTTPIMFNFPDPPSSMTQEEWRYIKAIAVQTRKWWSARRSAHDLMRVDHTTSEKMLTAWETIKQSQSIAQMFHDRKRVAELTDYGKSNYRAALFYAAEQKV